MGMTRLYKFIMPSTLHYGRNRVPMLTEFFLSQDTTRNETNVFGSEIYLEIIKNLAEGEQEYLSRSRKIGSIWQGILDVFSKQNITVGKDIYCACANNCNIDNLIEQLILD